MTEHLLILRKIPKFHSVFWRWNFVEMYSFWSFSRNSSETLQKLCAFTLKLIKTKESYHRNSNKKKITYNKTFWMYGKQSSLFSQIKLHLMKKLKLMLKQRMNTFFSTIISNPSNPVSDSISNDINDPVWKSIRKYKYHPSIKAIEKISKLNS